jgi:hypothetical protein
MLIKEIIAVYSENHMIYIRMLATKIDNDTERKLQRYENICDTINRTLKLKTNSMAQEPEGSSPHSQQPATGPCPEPVESNPHPPSQSP